MKIYYLSRSFFPFQQGGGPMMRAACVKFLEELNWDVTVVIPNLENQKLLVEDKVMRIPFKFSPFVKIRAFLQRIGLVEDALDGWVKNAHSLVVENLQPEDIVFATTGGDLASVKLGSLLKNSTGCKFVVNYRDPIDGTSVSGRRKSRLHFNRDKYEKSYLKNADLVVTSSKSNLKNLVNKLPFLTNIISNIHFGYISSIHVNESRLMKKQLSVVFSGSMLPNVQAPEILLPVISKLPNISFQFVGDYSRNKTLQSVKLKNIALVKSLSRQAFLTYMEKEADVGFLSLIDEYYSVCIPSKLYEYINLGLPIIAVLPRGEAMDIINENGYGLAVSKDNVESLISYLKYLSDPENYSEVRNNVLSDKNSWSMKEKTEILSSQLKSIL